MYIYIYIVVSNSITSPTDLRIKSTKYMLLFSLILSGNI